jgi:hypothetical protein
MRGHTPLIRLLARDFVDRYQVGYEEALDSIYRSKIFKGILDERTTLATWAPQDLLELYEQTER